MIKKLRIKLIAVSMISLAIVLFIIIGSVNLLNYLEIINNANEILLILNENEGNFPPVFFGNESPNTDSQGFLKEKSERGISIKSMSPETPYETRYFSVLLNDSGEVISVDIGKIAAVNSETAIDYANRVWSSGNSEGFIEDYRYTQKIDKENVRITFLNCGRNLSTFRTFLFTSLGISLLGMLAVLILMIFLSGRIIKPVSESYEKQKRFITDAGHEIKTPLTIIDADAEVLGMDIGKNEWLEDIQKQTKRLAILTNDLIFLSKMDEGQNKFHMIEFPFSDIAGETAQSFVSLAKTQNKTFTTNIQPMLSVCGDEKALGQLISILLDNALKYSDTDGSISLKIEKQGRYVCMEVFNTVDCIEQEQIGHLFDRFYRADSSRNSQTGGYGIGLSLAAAIVEAHKGKITASTRDNKSFLITVKLPAV